MTIKPRRLELRKKGRRDTLAVDYATIYEVAMKLRWREQAEKKASHPHR